MQTEWIWKFTNERISPLFAPAVVFPYVSDDWNAIARTHWEMNMNDSMTEQTLSEQIEEAIMSDIRPYIEMDGGRIRFVEMKDGVVFVQLSGACGTCPSAQMTLKGGVERILKRRFPEIIAVELAGLDAVFPH